MRVVDKYLKTAKGCREAARKAKHKGVKQQYAEVAEIWESMAKERLRLLQLRFDVSVRLGATARKIRRHLRKPATLRLNSFEGPIN